MRLSRVRQRWQQNQPALCVASAFTDPNIPELIALLGFDCIWLDLEHSARSFQTATELIRATRVGCSDVIARPANGEFMRMQRMLEAGAHGIMYPRCSHEDEAATVVKYMKFAPQGIRGFDGGGPDMPYLSMSLPAYLEVANRETFLFVQIEDPAALERVEKIAAVPGVDGIFFGPGDFSVLAGIPGQMRHPLIVDAQKRVARAVAACGKRWGMPGLGVDHVKCILELGATFVAAGTDIVMLKQALEGVQTNFGAMGFQFENRLATNAATVHL